MAPSDLVVRRCQLGVRFVDAATGEAVADNLAVDLHAQFGVRKKLRPVVGPSGVHSFHSIPGVEEFEDPGHWPPASSPPVRRFALFAEDRQRRYLPSVVVLDLPRTDPEMDLPLFPAPKYTTPPQWAVVRVRLANRGPLTPPPSAAPTPDLFPAPWGVVDAEIAGVSVARGLSDHRGELALFFPYPTGDGPWTVTLTARFKPGAPLPAPRRDDDDTRARRGEPPFPPQLPSLLAQAPAELVNDWTAAATAFTHTFDLDPRKPPRAATRGLDPEIAALWVIPT